MANAAVDLGFAEEQEKYLLTSRFFPSKIGSTPAWLNLSENIPNAKDLECDYCNEPCIFLCQVYASTAKPHAFHRTIFVFICKNEKCCQINQAGNIKVFRNHLPLNNDFYPPTPPDESIEEELIKPLIKLCKVCGCNGSLVCSKCKKASYCCQSHQKFDWKNHKPFCGALSDEGNSESEILFPDYEIVIEQEEEEEEKSTKSEQKRLQEYEEMAQKIDGNKSHDIPEKDFDDLEESTEDKTFGKFKKIIDRNPTQVLRYQRHGLPLWISKIGILSNSQISKCELCNGRRTFEFQIMPQMLNYLKNYELDWGIIAVYTCEADCNLNGKYAKEFSYKQDIQKGEEGGAEGCEAEFNQMEINEKKEEKKEKIVKQKSSSKAPSSSKKAQKAFKETENWD